MKNLIGSSSLCGSAKQSDAKRDTPLAYLVSQPRSGSTLLQTILAGHPDVLSPPEPWLMLHLAFAVGAHSRDLQAPYDAHLYDAALTEFASRYLPKGLLTVRECLGQAASAIYGHAVAKANKQLFLDKTPRYYFIIHDLLQMLPSCRVVILFRNPLAVLASIVRTWGSSNPWNLSKYVSDLFAGPRLLADGLEKAGERGIAVRYEDLLSSPGSILKELQSFLGLKFVSGLEVYGTRELGGFGDPTGIYQNQQPNTFHADRWITDVAADPVLWRLAADYLEVLGPELVERLGYSSDALRDQLYSVRPAGTWLVPSLDQVLRTPRWRGARRIQRSSCALARKMSQVR